MFFMLNEFLFADFWITFNFLGDFKYEDCMKRL